MKIKNLIFATLVGLGIFSFQVLGAPPASAGLFDNAKNQACAGAQLADSGNCNSASADGLNKTIGVVINIISIIVAIVAVIMIIVNGLKFITSGGDTNKVASAKNGLLYAVIGLAVVGFAQFIVKYVINNVG